MKLELENPEIKVLIDEISKLKSEIIELRIELEGLKAESAVTNKKNEKNLNSIINKNPINSSKFKEKKNKDTLNKKNTHLKNKNVNEEKEISEKEISSEELNENKKTINHNYKVDEKDKKNFKDILKKTINSEVRYDTWLKTGVNNLSIIKQGEFVFKADNEFTKGILEVRYRDLVEEALKAVFEEFISVEFISIE
ncbi:MAG: hypothetical protein ACRC57_03055 [Sarcina sp.]